jgi:hypothetical protein
MTPLHTAIIVPTATCYQSTTTTETDTCSHCSSKELQYPHLTASEVSKKPTFNRLSHMEDTRHLYPAAHRGRISLRARASLKSQCHTDVHYTILNPIDNCLARRVAYGIGAEMPPLGSGPMTNVTNLTARFPSLYPLVRSQEPKKAKRGSDGGHHRC